MKQRFYFRTKFSVSDGYELTRRGEETFDVLTEANDHFDCRSIAWKEAYDVAVNTIRAENQHGAIFIESIELDPNSEVDNEE